MSTSYAEFSQFYDNLTLNVNYKKRAEYIVSVLNKHNHKSGLTLDLACGTGSLTLELKKLGVDIYGIDSSSDMLIQAKDKAYEANEDILYLCQKMQNIDLYGTIDTCLCTLDSINHLTKKEDVIQTFKKVSLFMNKGGLFVFDVNTEYKHQQVLSDNTFIYDTEDVYCIWQNSLQKDNVTVRINLDFFSKTYDGKYTRSSESFSEKAYSNQELNKMLVTAGFKVLNVYDELTFENKKETSQRLIYVAQKI